jgi:hypothetical protein
MLYWVIFNIPLKEKKTHVCKRVVLSEDEMETSDHGRGHDSGDLL